MNFDLLEKLYHQICKNHVQRLYEEYNSDINKYNKTPYIKEIIIQFNPENTNNASAKSDEKDIIILYKGLLKKLHDCASKIVESEFKYRDDNEKITITVFLVSTSLNFIISHEFAHIYYGHCDMLNKINKSKIELMFTYDNSIGLSPLDFQTLEMNADAVAVCRTVDFVLFKPYHTKNIQELFYNNGREKDLLLRALNITFFTLREFMPPIYRENYRELKHHPELLRQFMNYNTLEKYAIMEHNYLITSEEIDAKFAEDEAKLSELYFIPKNLEHYKRNLNKEMILHEKKMRENLRHMNARLRPSARAELPEL